MILNDFFRHLFSGYEYLKTGKTSYSELAKLQEYQYYDLDKMQSIVDEKIVRLVNHAYMNVPFYRNLYDSFGVDVKEVKGAKNLDLLPVVNKTMIRKHFPDDMMASGLKTRAIYDLTSGSTGVPFEFFDDQFCTPTKLSSHMLFNTWMGVGPNDKHAHIASPKAETIKSRVKKFIFNKNSISSLKIKPDNMNG